MISKSNPSPILTQGYPNITLICDAFHIRINCWNKYDNRGVPRCLSICHLWPLSLHVSILIASWMINHMSLKVWVKTIPHQIWNCEWLSNFALYIIMDVVCLSMPGLTAISCNLKEPRHLYNKKITVIYHLIRYDLFTYSIICTFSFVCYISKIHLTKYHKSKLIYFIKTQYLCHYLRKSISCIFLNIVK